VKLVVDLSGTDTYRPRLPEDAPVLRVRFGAQGLPTVERAFDRSLILGRTLDRIAVTLEWSNGSAIVHIAPVVVNPTSHALTTNEALWKAAATLPRVIRRLASSALETKGQVTAHMRSSATGRAIARGTTAARFGLSAAQQLVFRDQWTVGIQRVTPGLPDTRIVAAADTIWAHDDWGLADPFLFELGAVTYLFVERIRPGEHGVIAVGVVGDDGAVPTFNDVLKADHHLSYPTVLEEEGTIWLVPESSRARQIRLFHADVFPDTWSYAATLLNGIVAFDPTLHHNEDGYWLWAAVAPFGRGHSDELWLFHSQTLTGPWRPHGANPVVEDPRYSRPAGSLFTVEGRLFRPSQDRSRRYGGRIVLNEVLDLSVRRYRERPVATIEPEWYDGLVGTHTLSRGHCWQAIDGARRVLSPLSPRWGTHL
jgi:hypothetical protein